MRFVHIIHIFLVVISSVSVARSVSQQPHRQDVCERTHKAIDPKIVCHCSEMGGSDTEFKKADCWLHASDLREDDVAWDGFGRSANIKELSFVVFVGDNLTFLPQKGMYYLTDLTKFSLIHADIPSLNSYAFSKLEKLEEISLVNNHIVTMEDYAFLKLENLKSLNLSFNQITHIDRYVFYKNYKLELLHLTINNITAIAERAFADLNNLIELRLDYNLIQRITSKMLIGLTSLMKLALNGNYISAIDEDTFEHNPALEYLNLAQNSLQWIAPDALKWTPRLKYIDLDQNELKQLDANLFHSMPNLNHLNVARNLLSTFEVDKDRFMIERFLSVSSVLYLHENNLVCDCRLLWLYDLRNRTRSGTTQKALDNLNCDLKQDSSDKTEQVFLLRLHYENFDCKSPAEITAAASQKESVLKHHQHAKYPQNYHSAGFRISRNGIIFPLLLLISSLLCHSRY